MGLHRRGSGGFVDVALLGDSLPHGRKLILGIVEGSVLPGSIATVMLALEDTSLLLAKNFLPISCHFLEAGGKPVKPTTVQSNNVGVRDLSAVTVFTSKTIQLRIRKLLWQLLLLQYPFSVDSQGHRQKPYKMKLG